MTAEGSDDGSGDDAGESGVDADRDDAQPADSDADPSADEGEARTTDADPEPGDDHGAEATADAGEARTTDADPEPDEDDGAEATADDEDAGGRAASTTTAESESATTSEGTHGDPVEEALGDLVRDVRAGTAGALAGTALLVVADLGAGAGTLAGLADLLGAGPDAGVGAVAFFLSGALGWSTLFSSLRPYLPGGRLPTALGLVVVLWLALVAGFVLLAPDGVGSLPVAAGGALLGFVVYGFVLSEAAELLEDLRSPAPA